MRLEDAAAGLMLRVNTLRHYCCQYIFDKMLQAADIPLLDGVKRDLKDWSGL
jgi:hypothetical protein